MKYNILGMPERPAFMRIVDFEQRDINEGYILQIDEKNMSASIIKLNKRRSSSMIKTVVKALEGFETIFDELNAKKVNLEADKEVAIQEAIAEVVAKFAENAERIDKAIETISITEEIEVPDEEISEEVATEQVDNTITY